MKRFCMVMVIGFALASLASFVLAQDALTQTFTPSDNAFSFQYPDGWTVNEIAKDSSGVTGALLTDSPPTFEGFLLYGPTAAVKADLAQSLALDTSNAKSTTVQLGSNTATRLEAGGGLAIEYIVPFTGGNELTILEVGTGSTDLLSKTDPTVMALVGSFQASGQTFDANAAASTTSTTGGADLSGAQPITLANAAQVAKLTTLTVGNGLVNALAFSPDGKSMAVDTGNNISLVDIASGKVTATLEGHTDIILSLAFSPDGKTLASGSQDQTVRLWDVATAKLLNTITVDSGYPRSRAVISPDGKTVAQANSGPLRMWDIASGKEITTIQATGGDVGVNDVAFSPDGTLLATAGADFNVQIWDVATGKLDATLTGHTGNVNSVAFSPDGKTLASTDTDKSIRLWDVASGKLVNTLTSDTMDIVYDAAFSPDGSVLASTDERTVWLWDVAGGKQLAKLQTFAGFSDVVFSPDGRLLAFANADGGIELWGVASS